MQQLNDLTVPLISENTKNDIQGNLLYSMLNPKDPENQEQNQEVQKQDDGGEEEKFQPLNFNQDHYSNYFETVGSVSQEQFYKKATAFHHIPTTEIKAYCIKPSNPSIYATISKSSKYFNYMELHEFMCLDDYRKLAKIRLTNYLNLLRMIPKISGLDKDIYQEVKEKLFQVKPVADYLGVNFGTLYDKLYNDNGKPCDLEEEDSAQVDNKIIDDGQEEEDQENPDDEDVQFLKFFSQSSITGCWDYPKQDLLKEEKKWVKRAEWLSQMIDKFQQKPNSKPWVPWFQAKLEQLANLDVPIKDISETSKQVFYLFDYIYDQIKERGPQNEINEIEKYTSEKYSKDQQVYVDEEYLYPKPTYNIGEIRNQDTAVCKTRFNLREKLCLRVHLREKETDYFLTVYERKALGNEKLYEKRLNLRKKEISTIRRFEFHPTGDYLFLSMRFNSIPPSYNDRNIDLIFSINAQFKVPLFLKPNQLFIGFEQNKFYTASEEKLLVKKNKNNQYIEVKITPEQMTAAKLKESDDDALLEGALDEAILGQGESSMKRSLTRKTIKENKDGEEAQTSSEGIHEGKKEDKKTAEIKNEPEEKTCFVIYEYDLFEYDKIKRMPLFKIDNLTQEMIDTKKFGKIKDGFYFINKKLTGPENKTITYDIEINNDTYELEEKLDNNSNEQLYFNAKGDKLLMAFKKDDVQQLKKYVLVNTNKKIKAETELKNIKQIFIDEENAKFNMRVLPLYNDFVILLQKDKTTQVSVFLNDTLFSTIQQSSLEKIWISKDDKDLQTIQIYETTEEAKNNQITANQINYETLTYNKEKKEYQKVEVIHELINRQVCVQFPYIYFIYNHDQIYIKDLTMEDKKGYYYMNHFMAIDKYMRPLTVHAYIYNGKMCLNIPVINSNYTSNNFTLRVHQIKTFQPQSSYGSTHPYKWSCLIRYRWYAFNQNVRSNFGSWAGWLTLQEGELPNDQWIMVYYKNNSLYLEKRFKNQEFVRRYIITHYHENESHIDVSQPDAVLNYRKRGFWLVLFQQKSYMALYTHEMRYSFHTYDLVSLPMVWTYNEDDATNITFMPIIDTLVKDRIDIYLLQQNAQMKRFYASVPTYSNGANLVFEQDEQIYYLESIFAAKGSDANQSTDPKKGSGASASAKKVNLFETVGNRDIFIANQILYSYAGVIDLKADIFENKMQVGQNISQLLHLKYRDRMVKFNYSFNEAKLCALYNSTDPGENYFENQPPYTLTMQCLVVTPLINARQLPLFNQGQFKTPVIPIVNKEAGFTSVFTLSLHPNPNIHYIQPDSNGYWYNTIITHKKLQQVAYSSNVNLYPGILIKYFNGVEQQIPMKDRFLEIKRYNISMDGKYLILVGTKILDDSILIHSPKYIAGKSQELILDGMFIYRLTDTSMEEIEAIKFAEKFHQSFKEDFYEKINQCTKYHRQYTTKEIDDPLIGEFYWEDQYRIPLPKRENYIEKVDFKETDEEYEEYMNQKNKLTTGGGEAGEKKQTFINSFLSKKSDTENKEQEEKKEEEKVEEKKAVVVESLVQNTPGFDIPYYAQKNDYVKNCLDSILKERMVREFEYIPPPEENGETQRPQTNAQLIDVGENQDQQQKQEQPAKPEPFNYDFERYFTNVYTDAETEKINQIHGNIILSVNDEGSIFLINRLQNKLYFFYRNEKDEYYLKKIKFDYEFPIEHADSSGDYLAVWNDKRYQILYIKPMKSDVEEYDKVYQPSDFIAYSTDEGHTAMKKKELLDHLYVEFDNQLFEKQGVNDKIVGFDKYEYSIEDLCILHTKDKKYSIIRVKDANNYKYIKVYDFTDQVMIFFIECEEVLISGDKRFIWMLKENQVYDIYNGISTFFIWPGDQICTHAFSHMDSFNVTDDRTLMTTQGYLQLSFNLITQKLDEYIANANFDFSEIMYMNASNIMSYISYKVVNQKSILERIFNLAKLDLNDEKYKGPDGAKILEDDKAKSTSEQMKALQSLLQQLSTYKLEPKDISNFFLTFYWQAQRDFTGGIDKKDPALAKDQIGNIFQRLFTYREKRSDIIEDILTYIVRGIDVPIAPFCINTCFTQFLAKANSSVAFQEYLENMISQTTQMKEIDKLQILESEEKNIFALGTPIIDDQALSQIKKIEEAKTDVEVKYIYLGDLLSKNGEEIMALLSDKKYLDIMAIPFIKYLVMFQWTQIKSEIKWKLLYPFMGLLVLFSIYSFYFVHYSDFVETKKEDVWYMYLFKIVMALFNIGNIVLLLGVLCYFFFNESKQFLKNPSEYFTTFWNIADLLNYTLCFMTIILDIFGDFHNVQRPVAATAFLILWIKMFYFLRVFDATQRLIRMIIEIVNDMKNFLIVLLIGVLGFTGGLYIIQQGLGADGLFVGESTFDAFIYTYRLAQGDFQLDDFNTFADNGLYFEYYLIWFIFILGSLFLVIVLMNLLIAIMGDTFSKVLDQINNLDVREKVMLISENESLFIREKSFKHAQYLVIVNEKSMEGGSSQNWDGQINQMKREIACKIDSLQNELKVQMSNTQKDLRKRFQDQDEKSKKQSIMTEQKFTGHLKGELEKTAKAMSDQFIDEQIKVKGNVFQVQTQVSSIHDTVKAVRMMQEKFVGFKKNQESFAQNMMKHWNIDPKSLQEGV